MSRLTSDVDSSASVKSVVDVPHALDTQSDLNVDVTLSQVVRAGAGAGKTYTLTHQVLDFAEQFFREHRRQPRIVVTTFTRKATQELRERLLRLALKERPQLVEWVASRSYLQVSTIHGITESFLRRYGRKIGLDSSPAYASDQQGRRMQKRALRLALLKEPQFAEMLSQVNFNQLLDLVKGLDQKIRLEPDYRPIGVEEIQKLAVKEVEGLKSGLHQLLGEIQLSCLDAKWLEVAGRYQPQMCEFQVRYHVPEQVENDLVKLQEIFQAVKVLRKSAKKVDESLDEAKKLWVKQAEKLLTDGTLSPRVWKQEASDNQRLLKLVEIYQVLLGDMKRQSGLIELTDLEILTAQLIREAPEAAESFAAEWDYWLIDEFQDTSPVQVEILRKLVGDRPCFVVGDPQQSIYLFRGARSEVFLEKEEEISRTNGLLRGLNKNYRSKPELLHFLNDVFASLPARFQAMEPLDGKTDPAKVVARTFAALDPDTEAQAILARITQWLAEGVSPSEICILARKKETLYSLAQKLNQNGIPTFMAVSAGFYDRREIQDALAFLRFLINPHDNFNLIELLRSPWFRIGDRHLAQLQRSQVKSHWNQLQDKLGRDQNEFEIVAKLEEALGEKSKMGLSQVFQKYLYQSGLLEFSHQADSSGRREANLWKLIVQLAQAEREAGFSPQAFVQDASAGFALDEVGQEGDAVAAVEPNRVNLMTIHGSKGLQFRHVIVPGLNDGPQKTTWSRVSFAEDLRLWTHRFAAEDDEDSDGSDSADVSLDAAAVGDTSVSGSSSAFSVFLKRPKSSLLERQCVRQNLAREKDENLRVFYVALTRAVESVFLTWTEKTNSSDSWKKQIGLPLIGGLRSFDHYSILGLEAPEDVANWNLHEAVLEDVPGPWQQEQSALAQQALLMAQGKILGESLKAQRISVTQALAMMKADASSDFNSGPDSSSKSASNIKSVGHSKRMSVSMSASVAGASRSSDEDAEQIQDRILRAQLGTGVHRIFELLKYPSRDRIETLVRQWFPDQIEEVQAAIQYTVGLKQPPLMDILKNGFAEYGFIVRDQIFGPGTPKYELEGQIDLWGIVDETAWIVDYKTGSPKNRDSAFAQMQLYAKAVKRSPAYLAFDHALPIKCVALFPFDQQVYVQDLI